MVLTRTMGMLGLLMVLGYLVTVTSSYKVCKSNNDCTKDGCTCGASALSTNETEVLNPRFCGKTSAVNNTTTSCSDCESDNVGLVLDAKCMACSYKQLFSECSDLEPVFCTRDDNCGTEGCSCLHGEIAGRPMKGGICMNSKLYKTESDKCKNCTEDSDCPGSFCKPNLLGRAICGDCEVGPSLEAIGKCSGAGPGGVPGRTGESKQVNQTEPCVSTAWLRANSLLHAAIRHGGMAEVFCIGNNAHPRLHMDGSLPCGTAGHLLRTRSGELISYLDACRSLSSSGMGNCVRTVMSVSQLSHNFDWSKYGTDDGELSLTSLSAHPAASRWGTSRLLALLADSVNKAGFGYVTNAVAITAHRVGLYDTETGIWALLAPFSST